MGITNGPPTGYHAIHIIVKNGNVTLKGVVDNSGDSAIAEMQANSTPGVFRVDNDLYIANSGKKNSDLPGERNRGGEKSNSASRDASAAGRHANRARCGKPETGEPSFRIGPELMEPWPNCCE